MRSVVYELGSNQLTAALKDLAEGLGRWRLWTALASEDIHRRFKRSYIGVLWTTLSFALFVGVKVIIFSPLVDADSAFFTNYVAIGFFAWMYITAAITDGCNVFIVSESWLKGSRLPLTIFVSVSMARSLIFAFYNFLVVICLLAIYGIMPSAMAFWSLVVFGLFVLSGFSIHLILGIICARFRDVFHLVTAILRVMFFLTPIFWLPEQIGPLWDFLQYNPFAHYLIAFRDPLLTGTFPESSVIIVAAVTAALMVLAYGLLVFARKRLIFWL